MVSMEDNSKVGRSYIRGMVPVQERSGRDDVGMTDFVTPRGIDPRIFLKTVHLS